MIRLGWLSFRCYNIPMSIWNLFKKKEKENITGDSNFIPVVVGSDTNPNSTETPSQSNDGGNATSTDSGASGGGDGGGGGS